MIQESIIADFKKNGFEVLSTIEPELCSEDATRVLIRQILGAFSQYKRTMIVAKLRAAKQRKRASDASWTEGRKRFGHLPGEPETIQRVLQLRADGLNMSAITRQLNSEGCKTRTGSNSLPSR